MALQENNTFLAWPQIWPYTVIFLILNKCWIEKYEKLYMYKQKNVKCNII